MNEILNLILITLIPALELRASIPYGILSTNFHWFTIFIVCVTANIILGLLLYPLIDYFIKFMNRFSLFQRFWESYVNKTRSKIKNLVNKYGELAIAIYIGIPLPGSGVYSGSLAAYLLGLNFKKYAIATIIGVLIAGTVVTIISVMGLEAFNIFIKK